METKNGACRPATTMTQAVTTPWGHRAFHVLLLLGTLAVGTPVLHGQDAPPLRTVAFTTREGTWLSLDVTRDGRTLLVELLGDLYTLPVEGGRATPLLTGRAFQSQPRVSPDGRQLVYVSDESGSDNLWVAALDGSGARQVTRLPRLGRSHPKLRGRRHPQSRPLLNQEVRQHLTLHQH